ncbi:MAG: two-component system, sensor histidine kinase and response regulator [Gemmatimonadaceae bacterium]|jgi:PAS domain S-box-containing protein|nr:two-component system, sensor histidine kinase and response regulator [Gemmatimonadaceae bacterium]
MTVRRLFSSCATKLAVLFASSRLFERDSVSLAAIGCFWVLEPRLDFFRAIVPVVRKGSSAEQTNAYCYGQAQSIRAKHYCVPAFSVVFIQMPPIRESDDFQAMIANAPEGIIVYNFETFLYLNPFAAERLGAKAESLVGQPIMHFVHPQSRPLVVERLRQLAVTGRAGPAMDVTFVSRSGTVIPAEIVNVPITFDGQPAILGLIRDISQRLDAQRALRESEERFANAFRLSPHGMAFVALDGRWLRANSALCEILGYSEEELREIDFQAVTHPDDVAEDLAHLSRLLSGEVSSYHRVKRYYRKDRRLIWVSVAISAVHDAAGAPLYYVGQIEDITLQRQHQQQSLQAERLGGIAETTIAVAHEMNNVLTALTMNAELLANDASPEEMPGLAAEVLSAANRIASIVQRLRRVSDLKSVEYLGDKKMLDLSSGPHKAQKAS